MTPETEMRLLGYAGLIPFIACASYLVYLLLWNDGGAATAMATSITSQALAIYAAAIISYLAGVHAGARLDGEPTRGLQFAPGQLAVVAAWVLAALPALLPAELRFFALAALLVALLARDRASRTSLPEWYRRLRLRLTIGASASLFVAGTIFALAQ